MPNWMPGRRAYGRRWRCGKLAGWVARGRRVGGPVAWGGCELACGIARGRRSSCVVSRHRGVLPCGEAPWLGRSSERGRRGSERGRRSPDGDGSARACWGRRLCADGSVRGRRARWPLAWGDGAWERLKGRGLGGVDVDAGAAGGRGERWSRGSDGRSARRRRLGDGAREVWEWRRGQGCCVLACGFGDGVLWANFDDVVASAALHPHGLPGDFFVGNLVLCAAIFAEELHRWRLVGAVTARLSLELTTVLPGRATSALRKPGGWELRRRWKRRTDWKTRADWAGSMGQEDWEGRLRMSRAGRARRP